MRKCRVVEEDPPRAKGKAEDREVDFLVCRTCGSPCYIFEMDASTVQEAQCLVCGNDEPGQFETGDGDDSEGA